jgi:hypothetical protein
MYVCMYVCVDSESYTTTAAPEKPRNPLAVSGTWHSIDLEVAVPYNNGSVVYVCMYVYMYVSQCLYVCMDLTGNVAGALSCMLIVNILYVCMYVCVLVRW